MRVMGTALVARSDFQRPCRPRPPEILRKKPAFRAGILDCCLWRRCNGLLAGIGRRSTRGNWCPVWKGFAAPVTARRLAVWPDANLGWQERGGATDVHRDPVFDVQWIAPT